MRNKSNHQLLVHLILHHSLVAPKNTLYKIHQILAIEPSLHCTSTHISPAISTLENIAMMKERSFLQSKTKANSQISRWKFLHKHMAGSITETELTMDAPRTFHKHFSGIGNNNISHYGIKQHTFWKSSKNNASEYQEIENV